MPDIFEDVDLEELFDKSQPFACKHQETVPFSVKMCDMPAVVNALLEATCPNDRCFVSWWGRGLTQEWPLCADHLNRAAAGTLRCGACRTLGAYKLVGERPL